MSYVIIKSINLNPVGIGLGTILYGIVVSGIRIRIHRIRTYDFGPPGSGFIGSVPMFLGLPDPDLLVRGTDLRSDDFYV
jgi:hypothetical protein